MLVSLNGRSTTGHWPPPSSIKISLFILKNDNKNDFYILIVTIITIIIYKNYHEFTVGISTVTSTSTLMLKKHHDSAKYS